MAASSVPIWPPGGVVGVQVHGQVEVLAQRGDELGRSRRPQQAGHVLDGEHVRAGVDDLLGQAQVVVERVELLARVEQVAGVAQRHLGDGGAGVEHGLDGRAHLRDVVEGVEDAEDVEPGAGGLVHERVGDLGGVRGVADGVAATQQHLQRDVGHRLAQQGQALPRVLGQEAQRDVVGGATPRLHREQLGREPRDVPGDVQQVAGAHPGGQQALVGVAEGRVGDRHVGARAQLPGELGRADPHQQVAVAGGQGRVAVDRGQLGARLEEGRGGPVRLVDGDVGEVGEQLGAAVAAHPGLEQLGSLVDEARGRLAVLEHRVGQHRLEERDVRRDAADPELRQRPTGPAHGHREGAPAAGELDEHRVEVWADLGADEHRATVEAHAAATGRAVDGDLAGIRAEAVGGVLGGDAALQGGAAHVDVGLAHVEVVERLAGGDPHLGDDEVDVGDLLGDGVLHLDPRVHLDEDVAAVLAEEELDGARVEVADRLGEPHGIRAHLVTRRGVEVRRGRDLDDLLVAALHRAVALEQVQHGAGGVGEHLHLDVPRVDHGLLEVERRVAEGGVGLALGRLEGLAQGGGVVDAAHPAPAAAGDGLDEHREADALGRRGQLVEVGGRRGAVQGGQPGLARRGDGP